MHKETKAVIALVLAAVLWSTGGLLIKLVHWHPIAIAGGRSGIAAVLMYLYIAFFRKDISKKQLLSLDWYKWLGAIAYTSTVIIFVIANKMTAAANVIFLQYTAPVWVALLSGWLLKEKVSLFDWMIIITVISGMGLFFIGDMKSGQMLGNILAIFSGIFLAAVVLLLKMQKNCAAIEMTFLGNFLTFLVSIPFFFQSMPDSKSMLGILLLGVFQLGLSYILFSEAIAHVSAIEAILIPVIEPLLNPIWVLLMLGESPSFFAIIGGTIVLGAVTFRGIYKKKRKKLNRVA